MAKTGYGNFDYTVAASWRGSPHNYSITGNHSGSAFSGTDPATFMTGASSPFALSFAPFLSPSVKVVGARYYNGTDSAPVWQAEYTTESPAPAPLTPTAAAFGTSGYVEYLPLEVCVMLEAQVGMNSKSKPIYCRKFLRGVPVAGLVADAEHDSEWQFQSAAGTAASAMGNGSWYGNRVYVSPSGRQGSAGWTALTYPGNHQVPRGKKRSVKSTNNNVLGEIEKLIQGGYYVSQIAG